MSDGLRTNHQNETPGVQSEKMELRQTTSDDTQNQADSGAKSHDTNTSRVDETAKTTDVKESPSGESLSGVSAVSGGTDKGEKSAVRKEAGESKESPKSVPSDGGEVKHVDTETKAKSKRKKKNKKTPKEDTSKTTSESSSAKNVESKESKKQTKPKAVSPSSDTSKTASEVGSAKKATKKESKKQTKDKGSAEDLNANTKLKAKASEQKGPTIPGTSAEASRIDLLQSSTAEKFTKNDVRRTALVNEFVAQIHKFCIEQGFEPTGRQYMRARANLFELVGLRNLYMEHLKKTAAKACNFTKDRIRRKLFLTSNHKPSVDFLVGIVSGVPGCGKSTLVRKLLDSPISCYVALANPATERDYRGTSNVMTLDDLLLAKVPMSSDLLIVDEYTLAESAEILLLQRRLRSSLVLLVGDVAQGRSNNASNIEYLTLPVIYRKITSHRIGEETAKACSKQGNRIRSAGRKDKLILVDYEGETEETEKNLAFTEETRDDVKDCGYDCSLVSEVQGLEYESVTLFLRNTDRAAASDHHKRTVSMTRHKSLLIIRAEQEIGQPFLMGELSVSSKRPSNAHVYSSE